MSGKILKKCILYLLPFSFPFPYTVTIHSHYPARCFRAIRTKIPRHRVRNDAERSISVHRKACCWSWSEQQPLTTVYRLNLKLASSSWHFHIYMLGWRHQESKKVPITDGYVDYHREIGINKVSTVWAAMYFTFAAFFILQTKDIFQESLCFQNMFFTACIVRSYAAERRM